MNSGMIVCVTCGEVKTKLPLPKVYKIHACRKCLEHFKSIDRINQYQNLKERNIDVQNRNQLELKLL